MTENGQNLEWGDTDGKNFFFTMVTVQRDCRMSLEAFRSQQDKSLSSRI